MLFKVLFLLLISSVKFTFAPAISVFQYKFGYAETVLIITAGGFLGVLIFAFLTEFIVDVWNWFINVAGLESTIDKLTDKISPSNKKIFSKKNKLIVKIKSRYGLIGLSIITPVILSIPVGTFIALRYFPNYKITISYLLLSVAIWANILTYVIMFL